MFTAALLPYTQYVIMFVAGFMCIPTGRDAIVPGYPLMPGDPEVRAGALAAIVRTLSHRRVPVFAASQGHEP